jgi:hypothetical protein
VQSWVTSTKRQSPTRGSSAVLTRLVSASNEPCLAGRFCMHDFSLIRYSRSHSRTQCIRHWLMGDWGRRPRQARSYDEATASPMGWMLRNAQLGQLSHPLPVLRAREIDKWGDGAQYKALLARGTPQS